MMGAFTIDNCHTPHYAVGYLASLVQPRLARATDVSYDRELMGEMMAGVRMHAKGLFALGIDHTVVIVTRDRVWRREAALREITNIARPRAEWLLQNNFGGKIPTEMAIGNAVLAVQEQSVRDLEIDAALLTPKDQMRDWVRASLWPAEARIDPADVLGTAPPGAARRRGSGHRQPHHSEGADNETRNSHAGVLGGARDVGFDGVGTTRTGVPGGRRMHGLARALRFRRRLQGHRRQHGRLRLLAGRRELRGRDEQHQEQRAQGGDAGGVHEEPTLRRGRSTDLCGDPIRDLHGRWRSHPIHVGVHVLLPWLVRELGARGVRRPQRRALGGLHDVAMHRERGQEGGP
jgi:hypothetical protein